MTADFGLEIDSVLSGLVGPDLRLLLNPYTNECFTFCIRTFEFKRFEVCYLY